MPTMLELFVIGVLVLAGVLVFSVLGTVLSLLFGLLLLPFQLLGFVFKGLAWLLALPFLLLGGVIAAVVVGAVALGLLTPLLPLFLIGGLLFLLFRGRKHRVVA